jgi:hypothetical protein
MSTYAGVSLALYGKIEKGGIVSAFRYDSLQERSDVHGGIRVFKTPTYF